MPYPYYPYARRDYFLRYPYQYRNWYDGDGYFPIYPGYNGFVEEPYWLNAYENVYPVYGKKYIPSRSYPSRR